MYEKKTRPEPKLGAHSLGVVGRRSVVELLAGGAGRTGVAGPGPDAEEIPAVVEAFARMDAGGHLGAVGFGFELARHLVGDAVLVGLDLAHIQRDAAVLGDVDRLLEADAVVLDAVTRDVLADDAFARFDRERSGTGRDQGGADEQDSGRDAENQARVAVHRLAAGFTMLSHLFLQGWQRSSFAPGLWWQSDPFRSVSSTCLIILY